MAIVSWPQTLWRHLHPVYWIYVPGDELNFPYVRITMCYVAAALASAAIKLQYGKLTVCSRRYELAALYRSAAAAAVECWCCVVNVKPRVDAFLSRSKRCGFCPAPDMPDFDQLLGRRLTINCLREYWTIRITHCTSCFQHNLQHHRTITSDAAPAPMTDNCMNIKDTWVTVIL